MGRKCVVAGCENAVGLHGIPLDLKLRGHWLRAIGMEENSYLPTMSGVCDKHFTRDCFTNLTEFELGYTERLRLKSEAVPNTELPRRIQSPRILLPRPIEVSNQKQLAYYYYYYFGMVAGMLVTPTTH